VNLVEAFLAHAEARPEAPALVAPGGRTTTYAELAHASARCARSYQRAGIRPGDVILVARGVSPALYASLLGLFRLGAVACFPEPAAGLVGVAAAVEAARPKAMIAGALGRALRPFLPALSRLPLLSEDGEVRPGGGPLVSTPPEAPALLTFTSGSTGRPKGIVRSAGFLQLQHALIEETRRTAPNDVDLISLPVFILSNLAAGAASVIPAGNLRRPAGLDGAVLRRQMARHGVTRVIAPPAVCARLVENSPPLPALTAVFTGGGPVFPNLLHGLRAAAPNARVLAVYGSTEAEPIAHIAYDEIGPADWVAMAEGAGLLTGRPVPQIQVLIEDAEIQVAGPHVNSGYLDPEQDRATKVLRCGATWHRTGDAGRLDDTGRLWLLGRREARVGDLFPFAVETAALGWPGVRQAALVPSGPIARLAIAGDGLDITDLARRARALGPVEAVQVAEVPLDRRHNSKVDYVALKRRMQRL
jgi:acyl-CoA synthetase (AMP-forming)/AMP-acid ligase II